MRMPSAPLCFLISVDINLGLSSSISIISLARIGIPTRKPLLVRRVSQRIIRNRPAIRIGLLERMVTGVYKSNLCLQDSHRAMPHTIFLISCVVLPVPNFPARNYRPLALGIACYLKDPTKLAPDVFSRGRIFLTQQSHAVVVGIAYEREIVADELWRRLED